MHTVRGFVSIWGLCSDLRLLSVRLLNCGVSDVETVSYVHKFGFFSVYLKQNSIRMMFMNLFVIHLPL